MEYMIFIQDVLKKLNPYRQTRVGEEIGVQFMDEKTTKR